MTSGNCFDINTIKTKLFNKYFKSTFKNVFYLNENLDALVFNHRKEYIEYTDYVIYVGSQLELKKPQIAELKYTPNVFKNLIINYLSYFYNKSVRPINRSTWLITDLAIIIEKDLELSRFLLTTRPFLKAELNPFLEASFARNQKDQQIL